MRTYYCEKTGEKKLRVKRTTIRYDTELPYGVNTNVIGTILLEDLKRAVPKNKLVSEGNKIFIYNGYGCKITEEKVKGKRIGYIKISNGSSDDTNKGAEYIEIKHQSKMLKYIPAPILGLVLSFGDILPIATAVVLAATTATAVGVQYVLPRLEHPSPNNNSVPELSTEEVETPPVYDYSGDELQTIEQNTMPVTSGKQTIIDGIAYSGEYLTVSANDIIPLGNNPVNEGIELQFTVLDENGNKVYKSGKLKPGEAVQWVPAKTLKNGRHKVTIVIDVYHIGSGYQDIGTNLIIDLLIV